MDAAAVAASIPSFSMSESAFPLLPSLAPPPGELPRRAADVAEGKLSQRALFCRKTAEAAKGRPYGGEEIPMDRRGDLRSPLPRSPRRGDLRSPLPRSPRRGDLRSPLQSLLLEEESALPLPVAEEGSTLFPQRSENTRINVSPKCFSGTARCEWHPPIPREAEAGGSRLSFLS